MSRRNFLGAHVRRLAADFAEDDAFELDEITVTRLMRGEVSPATAPEDYAEVADMLLAARAGPQPDEFRGEAAALAAFRARNKRRSLRVPLVAAMTAAGLVAGGVAAAAGGLPAPARTVVRAVLSVLGIESSDAEGAESEGVEFPATPSLTATATTPDPRSMTVAVPAGPTPADPALVGALGQLCARWQSPSSGTGPGLDAGELAKPAAAGGADRIDAACAETLATKPPAPVDNTDLVDNTEDAQGLVQSPSEPDEADAADEPDGPSVDPPHVSGGPPSHGPPDDPPHVSGRPPSHGPPDDLPDEAEAAASPAPSDDRPNQAGGRLPPGPIADAPGKSGGAEVPARSDGIS
jgi:hypothetical protein